jgi:ribulose-5-phosphate 4-epimerase/fuculose-1-phosphate aldolase
MPRPPTHLVLYRRLGGIVHTHSPYASAWVQAGEHGPAAYYGQPSDPPPA